MMRALTTFALILALAACRQAGETPAPGASEKPASGANPAQADQAVDPLDRSALSERQDPDKLLGFLATAIGAQRWDEAALAWHGMDGEKVQALFGDPRSPLVTFGKGRQEGAAGSLYYEVPLLLFEESGRAREGAITLRRVNDVPGADERQLAWHVERLEWKN